MLSQFAGLLHSAVLTMPRGKDVTNGLEEWVLLQINLEEAMNVFTNYLDFSVLQPAMAWRPAQGVKAFCPKRTGTPATLHMN